MFRQLAGASALALILAGGAVAQDHDHDHDHDHGDVTLYRVFVGDHEKGQVTAFDLSEPDHRWTFPTTGQVKLFPVAGGAVVAAVQSMLADLGFQPGPVDGIYGPWTRQALRNFAETHDIAFDATESERMPGQTLTFELSRHYDRGAE